jgi:general secretion pathway protein F
MGISGVLSGYWWLILMLLGVGVYFLRRYYKTEPGRERIDAMSLRIPIFGPMLLMVAVARFASTLATLLSSGVPLLRALSIVEAILGNVVLKQIVAKAHDAVREGQAMAETLRKSSQFPPMVTDMIAVGERTGELAAMLERVSTSYESQVSRKLSTLTALLEPLMILVMGGVVFVIALAILLPMLQMNALAR